ncbi:hypothetical protein TNCV_4160281 [Trichonephila clavipes]|nr:hypothetical protein TNCV_4160281 [Trichonephila clavipes]
MRIPVSENQNVWFMHDSAPAYFLFAVRNHLHVTSQEVYWTLLNCYLVSMLHGSQSFGLLILVPSEISCVLDAVATVEDLKAWIINASADIGSTPNLFEHVRQSFVRGMTRPQL